MTLSGRAVWAPPSTGLASLYAIFAKIGIEGAARMDKPCAAERLVEHLVDRIARKGAHQATGDLLR